MRAFWERSSVVVYVHARASRSRVRVVHDIVVWNAVTDVVSPAITTLDVFGSASSRSRLSFFRGARGERGGLGLALRLRPRGRRGGTRRRSHLLVVAGLLLLLRGAILFLLFLLFGGRLSLGDALLFFLSLFSLLLARAPLLRRLLVADALSLCLLRQPRALSLRLLLLPRALLRRLLLLLGLRCFKRRRGGSDKV